jgi:hypothetical protein
VGKLGELRICVCLVKGDRRARWLVLCGVHESIRHKDYHRRVMLRGDDCCENCALDAAAAMEGEEAIYLYICVWPVRST